MSSLNQVSLIGRLGKDPETRYFPSGDAVCNFSVATSERWKDKQSGEQKERTEWHNIAVFDGLAEVAAKYLHKGDQVFLQGKLQTRKWQDKDGQDRYTTEVRVDGFGGKLVMVGGKREEGASGAQGNGGGQRQGNGAGTQQRPAQAPESDIPDDDIPF